MAGRVYEVTFNNQTFTAAVHDILSIGSTTNTMAFRLLEIVLGQVTMTTTESLQLTFKRFSGAFTLGSGGSALTPAKHNFGDAAATVAGRCNDTTQTTGGTAVTIRSDVFNEVNGYQYLAIPDKEIIIAPNQAFVLSMDTAPAAPRVINGSAVIEEMF